MKKFNLIFITTLFASIVAATILAFPVWIWITSLYGDLFNRCDRYFGFECGVFTKLIHAFIRTPALLHPAVLFFFCIFFAAIALLFYYPTLKHLKHHYTSAIPPYRIFLLAGLAGAPFSILLIEIIVFTHTDTPYWIVLVLMCAGMASLHYGLLKYLSKAFKISDEAIADYFAHSATAAPGKMATFAMPRIQPLHATFFSTAVLASVFSTIIISLTSLTCTKFLFGCMDHYRDPIILLMLITLSCIAIGIFSWVPGHWIWTNKFAAHGKKKYLIYALALPISLFMLLLTTVLIWVPYMHELSRNTFWTVTFPICILTSFLQVGLFRYFGRKKETAAG